MCASYVTKSQFNMVIYAQNNIVLQTVIERDVKMCSLMYSIKMIISIQNVIMHVKYEMQ
jgi:hypothetical protein